MFLLMSALLCSIGAAVLISGCEDLALLQEIRRRVRRYVTGVSLNKNSTEIIIGSSEQLTAVLEPADTADPGVTWTSDNEGAVTVDSSGLVTGIAEGTAIIKVTTHDGGYTDTCEVTVQMERLLQTLARNRLRL